MQCQIIAIGQKMPSWCEIACADYSKRLTRFLKHSFLEIPVAPRLKATPISDNKDEEGKKILQKIPSSHFVIALDEHGQGWSTSLLAKKIAAWQQQGRCLSFLIGGPDGLSSSCLERADVLWSLSDLTFPHPLVRVLLLEQLYRAMSLLANHPYHRE